MLEVLSIVPGMIDVGSGASSWLSPGTLGLRSLPLGWLGDRGGEKGNGATGRSGLARRGQINKEGPGGGKTRAGGCGRRRLR